MPSGVFGIFIHLSIHLVALWLLISFEDLGLLMSDICGSYSVDMGCHFLDKSQAPKICSDPNAAILRLRLLIKTLLKFHLKSNGMLRTGSGRSMSILTAYCVTTYFYHLSSSKVLATLSKILNLPNQPSFQTDFVHYSVVTQTGCILSKKILRKLMYTVRLNEELNTTQKAYQNSRLFNGNLWTSSHVTYLIRYDCGKIHINFKAQYHWDSTLNRTQCTVHITMADGPTRHRYQPYSLMIQRQCDEQNSLRAIYKGGNTKMLKLIKQGGVKNNGNRKNRIWHYFLPPECSDRSNCIWYRLPEHQTLSFVQ